VKPVPAFDYRRELKAHRREFDRAISNVLESGQLILGKQVSLFEEEFARFTGARYAVSVANGTDALFLSMKALGIGAGDEVITVPNTAIPTVSAIVSAGARPRFADIDPGTYLMDVKSAGQQVTRSTKAIIPVHLFGQSADMNGLRTLARKHKLHLIEDCAQAHGTTYKDRHVGTFGVTGCFSFYPTKNLGAFGDGGMIVTNRPNIAHQLRLLRGYGCKDRYKALVHGYNSRLDELQAALLRIRLRNLNEQNRRRQRLAEMYDKGLALCPIALPQRAAHGNHTFHQYVIRTPRRDALQKHLQEKEIRTNIHYPFPIYLQKAYRFLGAARGTAPYAEAAQKEILSLPMFPELTRSEIQRVISTTRAFFREL